MTRPLAHDGRLLVVVGPTGTGKSALALALAETLGGEIVGCDAVQVYRGFDCATAKPSADERRRVPHHLIDCADPRVDFSLADYVRSAEQALAAIRGRGRVAVVTGGTGLYLRGLLAGVLPAPARDPALRARLRSILDRGGARHLRRLLARLDPGSAARIAPRDTQRLARALELAAGGRSWSERLAADGTWAAGGERMPSLKIGLDTDRGLLGARLDERVDRFFDGGLIDEVRALLDAGVPPQANAFKAIGYREVLAAFAAGSDPETTRPAVKRSTRRYAKRQRTWFRKERGIVWLDAARDTPSLRDDVLRRWGGVAPLPTAPRSGRAAEP